MTKSVDHGRPVTVNSRALHLLVEAVGGLLTRTRPDDDARRTAFQRLVPVLEALDHQGIDGLRVAYLGEPSPIHSSNDGFTRRTLHVKRETRTIVVRGDLLVLFVEGRDEQYVDELVDWLTEKFSVSKG